MTFEGSVEIPLDVAFEVLEKLRLVGLYLDPPEDFKPYKWPTSEEYAKEIADTHKKYINAMADSMGVDISSTLKGGND